MRFFSFPPQTSPFLELSDSFCYRIMSFSSTFVSVTNTKACPLFANDVKCQTFLSHQLEVKIYSLKFDECLFSGSMNKLLSGNFVRMTHGENWWLLCLSNCKQLPSVPFITTILITCQHNIRKCLSRYPHRNDFSHPRCRSGKVPALCKFTDPISPLFAILLSPHFFALSPFCSSSLQSSSFFLCFCLLRKCLFRQPPSLLASCPAAGREYFVNKGIQVGKVLNRDHIGENNWRRMKCRHTPLLMLKLLVWASYQNLREKRLEYLGKETVWRPRKG